MGANFTGNTVAEPADEHLFKKLLLKETFFFRQAKPSQAYNEKGRKYSHIIVVFLVDVSIHLKSSISFLPFYKGRQLLLFFVYLSV